MNSLNRFDYQTLRSFSDEIKSYFEDGKIHAPIHLSGNNESQLIQIFKEVKPTDWVFSTHRSHYHALLHGIDQDWLKHEILQGRSIAIENIDKKFVTSAIVGGILPIALGVAFSIKVNRETATHVWVFVGDMAAKTGIFYETVQYASGHNLPLSIVVEDNGFSTNTPTQVVWGDKDAHKIPIYHYSYERIYPHQGSGKWVKF